jgi:hypothetical protein
MSDRCSNAVAGDCAAEPDIGRRLKTPQWGYHVVVIGSMSRQEATPMFGRHTSAPTNRATNNPGDTVGDERGERFVSSPDEGRTDLVRNHSDQTEPMPTAEPGAEPVTEPVAEPVGDSKRWTHVSALATLSLIVGTLAVAATLTGLLAPLGFAAGVLAVLIGILALYAVRRPAVTGHTLLGIGVLFGLVAIVLSLLAMNHSLSWLDSKKDEIATVHTWLDAHIHWLRRW